MGVGSAVQVREDVVICHQLLPAGGRYFSTPWSFSFQLPRGSAARIKGKTQTTLNKYVEYRFSSSPRIPNNNTHSLLISSPC